jgi:hypothetical protein
MTFAPIFTTFSQSKVNDHRSTAADPARLEYLFVIASAKHAPGSVTIRS